MATALLDLAFNDPELYRIVGECIESNVGSARVPERISMQREARLRENCCVQSTWGDTLIDAILNHEWRQLHPAAGKNL